MSTNDLVSFIFSVSTDVDQMNYFSGESVPLIRQGISSPPCIPDGVYRVVDGELVRVIQGVPPILKEQIPCNIEV